MNDLLSISAVVTQSSRPVAREPPAGTRPAFLPPTAVRCRTSQVWSVDRRHAGRPSLSGRAGHSKRVDLRVDDQTYEAIQRIANQGNRKVSDVVREAINRYLEAS